MQHGSDIYLGSSFCPGRARLRFYFLHDVEVQDFSSLPLFLSHSVRLLIMPLHSFVLSFGRARQSCCIGCLRFPCSGECTWTDLRRLLQGTIDDRRLSVVLGFLHDCGKRWKEARENENEKEAISLLQTEPKNNSP